MDNQKPWGSEPLEEDFQDQSEHGRKPKYEVVREFKFGRRIVSPGEELPEVSEKAIASLLRKGVLKAL